MKNAPEDHILVLQVVWPYGAGEVIVQNYNAVLSLAHLYQSADVIFAVENDAIHNICTQLLSISKVSFMDMNRVIAGQLALSLVPASVSGSQSLICNHIGNLFAVVDSFYQLVLVFLSVTDCTRTVSVFVISLGCDLYCTTQAVLIPSPFRFCFD